MRNLNYLNPTEIDEFDLIANSKRLDARTRLQNIRDLIILDYEMYLQNFSTIAQIGPSMFDNVQSDDLKKCYQIKSKARNDLLRRIIGIQTDHFKHICPYCLIIPRTTYDHYIPESAHPAYSVLAKNLIPCCSVCNGKKLEYWRQNGNRAIIHFYNDIIPQIQFLRGAISFNNMNIPIIQFNIQPNQGISNNLFAIIQLHFDRLDLLNRYSLCIDLVVSDIHDDVESNRAILGGIITPQIISDIILQKSNRLKTHYGANYWKSISLDLLANTPQFINNL